MDNLSEKIYVDDQEGVRTITINRPEKKNAFDQSMFPMLASILEAAQKDDSIKACVITGAGDSFSSGNDLGNFLTVLSSNQFKSKEEMAEFGGQLLHGIVKVFIDFPKPLIAAVNGAAIGIMFTTLPLFDLVFATPTATFLAPFSRLGQAPEGCSTFTFPQLMGTARATEVLLLGKKINAEQAKTLGLVNEIIPEDFMTEVQDRVKKLVLLPQGSIMESKALMRRWNKEKLHMVNVEECKMLARRWQSDECMEAVLNFFQRKAKL